MCEQGVLVLGMEECILWFGCSIFGTDNGGLQFSGDLLEFGFDLDLTDVVLSEGSPSLLDF